MTLPISWSDLCDINYADFLKCGDIVVLPKRNLYALCCRFCSGSVFARLEPLMSHIAEQHGKELAAEIDQRDDVEIVGEMLVAVHKAENQYVSAASVMEETYLDDRTLAERVVLSTEKVQLATAESPSLVQLSECSAAITENSPEDIVTMETTNENVKMDTEINSQKTKLVQRKEISKNISHNFLIDVFEDNTGQTIMDLLENIERDMQACTEGNITGDEDLNSEVPEEIANTSEKILLPRLTRIEADEKELCGKNKSMSAVRKQCRREASKYQICEHCPRRFATSYKLKRHIRFCHIMKRVHKCGKCNITFRWESELKRHTGFHENVRPFQCTYCDHASTTIFNLKVHIRTHTGERPFKCSYCDKTFAKNTTLKAHLLKHSF